ncbi:MAG: hypothetical protein WCI71_19430 [Bacteroidota bacterium]
MFTSKYIHICPFLFRKCLPLFLLLLLLNPASGQKPKGRIISYSESYFSVSEQFGRIIRGPKLNDTIFHDELVSFDENGNISQSVEYNADGTVFCKYKGRLDYEDNNVESIYLRFNPELIMDKKPFIMESAVYSWGELCEMSYVNDSSGRPMEETIYDLMGNLIIKIDIKRDENGHAIEDDYSDGTVYQYKYDSKGNRIEWVARFSTGSTSRTTVRYDESGEITEMMVDNFFKSRYKFHYDNYIYKYLYDSYGNWTERIDFENGTPRKMVIRKIEYSSSS